MTRRLQITLYIIGTYQAVFGTMVIVAPGLFHRITQTTPSDKRITLLYGSYLLIFAFVAFMAAREEEAGASCR